MCGMARPRKPLLSTDRIVETARVLVDAEGLAAVSTRRLAAELGVSGPSLYNHFRTKDQILEAVADSVSAQVDLSMFSDGRDWRTALHDWAVSYRSALRDHPNIVPVLATGPGRRPAGLRLADAVYGAMVDAGWPAAQATSIGALMRYFIMGSALGSFAGDLSTTRVRTIPPTIRISGRLICLPSSRRRWTSGRSRWGSRRCWTGWRDSSRRCDGPVRFCRLSRAGAWGLVAQFPALLRNAPVPHSVPPGHLAGNEGSATSFRGAGNCAADHDFRAPGTPQKPPPPTPTTASDFRQRHHSSAL